MLAGGPAYFAVRVAAHWDAAGVDAVACDQAATWWQRASDESARLRAYEDAAALQAKAILAADAAGVSATRLAETSLAAARAWYRAGRYADAVAAAEQAAAHADAAGRPELVADAALAVGWVSYPAAQEVITRLARMALDQGGASISDATRARLLAQQVAMLGNYAEAHGGPRTTEAMVSRAAAATRQHCWRRSVPGWRPSPRSGPRWSSGRWPRRRSRSPRGCGTRARVLAHTWLLTAAVELGSMDLAAEELQRLRLIATRRDCRSPSGTLCGRRSPWRSCAATSPTSRSGTSAPTRSPESRATSWPPTSATRPCSRSRCDAGSRSPSRM